MYRFLGFILPIIFLFIAGKSIAQQKVKIGNRPTRFATNTVLEVEGSTDTLRSRMVMLNTGTVGIGTTTPRPSAILDLTATNKALLLPRVQLTGLNDVATVAAPVSGMMVSNIAAAGVGNNAVKANNIYRFNGVAWDLLVDKTELNNSTAGFSFSILGYTPLKGSARTVPATAPGGATVTEVGCKTNLTNGHFYCAYTLSAGTNFYNTFQLAKNIGGYVVTMTSLAEISWVNTNIVAAGTGYSLGNCIWIGYNKVAYPGNPNIFQWITGEDFVVNWSTFPTSTPDNWFLAGQPDNAGGTEGSCHIMRIGASATRRWADIAGNSLNDGGGGVFNQVIVEFNAP